MWFLIPETKKVSLEEIDVLFGGSNHVEKGGNLLHVQDAHHANLGVDNIVSVGSPVEMGGVGKNEMGSKEEEVRELKGEEIHEVKG